MLPQGRELGRARYLPDPGQVGPFLFDPRQDRRQEIWQKAVPPVQEEFMVTLRMIYPLVPD